jgi:hypothetical protein
MSKPVARSGLSSVIGYRHRAASPGQGAEDMFTVTNANANAKGSVITSTSKVVSQYRTWAIGV